MSQLTTIVETLPVETMTTVQLRDELSRALEITSRHLVHLAAVWRELETRGEDLSHLRSGLWTYMPMIASGKLLAETVVKYAGHAMLLRRMAALPIDEQRRLMSDDQVPVLRRDGDRWIEASVPLGRLTAPEIGQVLTDHVRTFDEQKPAAAAIRRTRQTSKPRVATDVEGWRIGSTRANLSEMRQAVIVAAKPRGEHVAPKTRQILIDISDQELLTLKTHAANAGIPAYALVRAALATTGFLSE